jgi:hypothetical protein
LNSDTIASKRSLFGKIIVIMPAIVFAVLRIRDPLFDPWIRDQGWVKSKDPDPRWVKSKDPDPGSGMDNPDHIS